MIDDNIASRHRFGDPPVEPLQVRPNWWLIGTAIGCVAVWGAIIWGFVELAK